MSIKLSVEMDPEMAKMVFFSKENSANWVVLEKWHEYQLEAIRQQLGRSNGSYSKGNRNYSSTATTPFKSATGPQPGQKTVLKVTRKPLMDE